MKNEILAVNGEDNATFHVTSNDFDKKAFEKMLSFIRIQ